MYTRPWTVISFLFILSFCTSDLLADEKKDNAVPYSDGFWIIEDYLGVNDAFNNETDEKTYIGQKIDRYKSYVNSPFFRCETALESSYITLKTQEFYANPIFKAYKKHKKQLKIQSQHIFVEHLFCHSNQSQLSLFIQTAQERAFYQLGNVIFIMRYSKTGH